MKTIESIKVNRISAGIHCTDGAYFLMDYDIQDAYFFEDDEEIWEWIKNDLDFAFEDEGIEFDKDKCMGIFLWLRDRYGNERPEDYEPEY